MLKAETASFPSVGEVNKDKGTVDFKDYKGVTYNTCTSVDHDRPWCVTDSEEKLWGNCPDSCQGNCETQLSV